MLERVAIHDLPSLQVTKKVTSSDGSPRFVHREFSKLSLGQQQSVLLALMLSSSSNKPLIIDQPEDNLDGEFIYSTLVPVLRLAKERRQVIIVTHNPNVAVLGDAELIIVMKAANDKGIIRPEAQLTTKIPETQLVLSLRAQRRPFYVEQKCTVFNLVSRDIPLPSVHFIV